MAWSGSKDFSEHYVTQGAGAADLNGGGPNLGAIGGADGPVATYANCDVAAGIALHWDIDNNNGGGGWGATQVGDFVRIDTAGVAELGRVTTINLGADPDVIEVVSGTAGGITAPVNGKNCNVGGAFATAQAAADLLEAIASIDATIGPCRINIKRHGGTAYDEAFDIDTNAGDSLRPITYEGYDTAPGDIDWATSESRSTFLATAVAGTAVVYVDVPYIRLVSIDAETAVAAKRGFHGDGACDGGVMLNCRGKGTTNGVYINSNANDYVIVRGLWEDGAQPVRFDSPRGRFLGNIVRGGSSTGLWTFASQCVIAWNYIYDNAADGVLAIGDTFTKVLIAHNIIADNGGDGIDLAAESDLENNVITNNIIAHNGGWGIAGTAVNNRFGLIDYNVIISNASGAVQDIEAGGSLIDDSNHNDEANAPFTGANAGARAANFYELTSEARQIQQLFADADFVTYPDAGAAQATYGGVGRGFMRGVA